jgi:formylmethanofuran dehydrogenase subunit B
VNDKTITCPFCGLACDDLHVSPSGVDARGCGKGARGFARAATGERPHNVAGEPVSFENAVAAAASLLRRSRSPLFHGLAADVHGIRAILALADRVGGVVDHRNSTLLLANLAVARATGWVTATFGEVANRADFILLVGADPARNFPRFHERLVRNPAPLYRERVPDVAYLGPPEFAPAPGLASLQALVQREDVLGSLGLLATVLRSRAPPNVPAPVAAIGERLVAARYGAIVWDVSAFAPEEAELAVELLARMLQHLNLKSRCVGLPVGGSENGVGAAQATLWQSGWPLRVGFGDGPPRHDPWRFDGARVLVSDEADAVVWVAALVAEPPPVIAAPVVAIVAHDVELAVPAAVELRVGIPGIDHDGEVIRGDTVIALPLAAARPSPRPGVADAARAILTALEAGA